MANREWPRELRPVLVFGSECQPSGQPQDPAPDGVSALGVTGLCEVEGSYEGATVDFIDRADTLFSADDHPELRFLQSQAPSPITDWAIGKRIGRIGILSLEFHGVQYTPPLVISDSVAKFDHLYARRMTTPGSFVMRSYDESTARFEAGNTDWSDIGVLVHTITLPVVQIRRRRRRRPRKPIRLLGRSCPFSDPDRAVIHVSGPVHGYANVRGIWAAWWRLVDLRLAWTAFESPLGKLLP